ncbi:ATP-binding cassette domain-containing protein, partial [Streptococcus parasanguinis]
LFRGHHLVNKLTLPHFIEQQRSSLKNLQDKYLGYGLTKITGILLTGISFEFISLILFSYLAYSLYHQQIGIPEVVASFGYITAFSEPIQEILYDLQMLESVKPVIKSFQTIVKHPSSIQSPHPSFETITLKNLSKQLGESTLKISFATIHKGDKIALIGENGSGKSSLLNILNGTDEDFQGEILLNDLPLNQLWGRFGLILQQEHSFISSYENNVTLFNTFLAEFKDAEFEATPPQSLSGGQQQRMYLNREKNRQSPLVIMDEPFSALDAISRKQLQALTKDLHKEFGMTTIFVTHDTDEALKLGDRIAVLQEGEIVQVAAPETILQAPATGFVADLFGGAHHV